MNKRMHSCFTMAWDFSFRADFAGRDFEDLIRTVQYMRIGADSILLLTYYYVLVFFHSVLCV